MVKLTNLIDRLQDLTCNDEEYNVTCNKVLDIPLIIIKDTTGKIEEAINLKDGG